MPGKNIPSVIKRLIIEAKQKGEKDRTVADRFSGPLVRVCGRMNAMDYQNILGRHMFRFAKDNMPGGWIFQQNNDPKHKARTTTHWFTIQRI
jgi:hypothetical protein